MAVRQLHLAAARCAGPGMATKAFVAYEDDVCDRTKSSETERPLCMHACAGVGAGVRMQVHACYGVMAYGQTE